MIQIPASPSRLPHPEEEHLELLSDLLVRGRELDALQFLSGFAPLTSWTTARGCALASRLVGHLGGSLLSRRLSLRAIRLDPTDPEACAGWAIRLMEHRGPLEAWKYLETIPSVHSEVECARALAAIRLRDFKLARQRLDSANRQVGDAPWQLVLRAHLLEEQDRMEEAIGACRESCRLHPEGRYRPAILLGAHLLHQSDRLDEGVAWLQCALDDIQNPAIPAQLHVLHREREEWDPALRMLETVVERSPLARKDFLDWAEGQKVYIAHRRGEDAKARELAGNLDDPYHRGFLERSMSWTGGRHRVVHEVSYVRQNFKTCAPATQAAIARYWGASSDHLRLAEEMCYDGTPHWKQREWAESNGWRVVEFKVDRTCAIDLIERGLPFAISVVGADAAHMMAVVGFDRIRDTLVLRDPSVPFLVETPIEDFLKRFSSFGPHGMLFVPESRAELLSGLDLPDVEPHIAFHRLNLALESHRRQEASRILEVMEEEHPGHALVARASVLVGAYDGNEARIAKGLDRLIELHPQESVFRLQRLSTLRQGSREDRIRFIRESIEATRDPSLEIQLAHALLEDARNLMLVRACLDRARRKRHASSEAIAVESRIAWEEGRKEAAVQYSRFAACLDWFREDRFQAWFDLHRWTHGSSDALGFLEDRFNELSGRSPQPGSTLAWALGSLDRNGEARSVLSKAIDLLPEDGSLRLRAAALAARMGDRGAAELMLESARGRGREVDWLRTACEIAERNQDRHLALQRAREILRTEPLALDAHSAVLRQISMLEGPDAARRRIHEVCQEYPNHCGLHRMAVDPDLVPEFAEREEGLRHLLRISPDDPWAMAELAQGLSGVGRHEEAEAVARSLCTIAPTQSRSHATLGVVLSRMDHREESRGCHRAALEKDIDNPVAMQGFLESSTGETILADLGFVESELVRQVVEGTGLRIFIGHARQHLPQQEVRRKIEHAVQSRPDLWIAASALVEQLTLEGDLEEALSLATTNSGKFFHVPRVWLDLSDVHRQRGENELALQAAHKALDLAGGWPPAVLCTAACLERLGRLPAARAIYRSGVDMNPDSSDLRRGLAISHWIVGDRQAALDQMEQAIETEPDSGYLWEIFSNWCGVLGAEERMRALGDRIVAQRPGSAKAWFAKAWSLEGSGLHEERIQALERSLELSGGTERMMDELLRALAEQGRAEDAMRRAQEYLRTVRGECTSIEGRLAWILRGKGDHKEARDQMRGILQAHPDYLWGWERLAEWELEDQRLEEALEVHRKVAGLSQDSAPVVILAKILLDLGRTEEAHEAFLDALARNPADKDAAWNLLLLKTRIRGVEDSRAFLERIHPYQPAELLEVGWLHCQLREGRMTDALDRFARICGREDFPDWSLRLAFSLVRSSGASSSAGRVLREMSARTAHHRMVPLLAVQYLVSCGDHATATEVVIRVQGSGFPAAVVELVSSLRGSTHFRWLRKLVRRREDSLRADAQCWGAIGAGWLGMDRPSRAAAWLSDWRSRSQIAPWMSANLVRALRRRQRFRQARQELVTMLERWGYHPEFEDLMPSLAFEDLLAGEVSSARERMEHFPGNPADSRQRTWIGLVEALLAYVQDDAGDSDAVLRRNLDRYFAPGRIFHLGWDLFHSFRRTGGFVGLRGAGLRTRIWFFWRTWFWPLSLGSIAGGAWAIGRFLS